MDVNILEKHFELNSAVIIKNDGDEVIVYSCHGKEPIDNELLEDKRCLDQILSKYKGNLEITVNSDFFSNGGLGESEFSIKDFNEETIKEVYLDIIKYSTKDLVRLMNEFGEPLIYEATYNQENGYMRATVGLDNNVRVILLEMEGRGGINGK